MRAGRFEQYGFILLVANKLKDDAEIVAGGARPRILELPLELVRARQAEVVRLRIYHRM